VHQWDPRFYPSALSPTEIKYFQEDIVGEHVDCHLAYVVPVSSRCRVLPKKTCLDMPHLNSPRSNDMHNSLPSSSLNDNLSGSTIQEATRRWWKRQGTQGRQDDRDGLEQRLCGYRTRGEPECLTCTAPAARSGAQASPSRCSYMHASAVNNMYIHENNLRVHAPSIRLHEDKLEVRQIAGWNMGQMSALRALAVNSRV
jgi:hypothetical protein